MYNYVHSVIQFVKATAARRVHLEGDSQVALLSWIEKCVPANAEARALVELLFSAQLELGFTLTVSHLRNTHPRIRLADKMSKGHSLTKQAMVNNGYVQVSPTYSQF